MVKKNKLNPIEAILHKWLAPVKEDLPPLYLVGGAVRDHLLSRSVNDIDLVCIHPLETATILGKHRNAAVVPFEKKKNAVCYRVVDRKNTQDFLDIVKLRNNSITHDLQDRDFTINSIAIKIAKDGKIHEIIDPLNGADDLQRGLIKVSGPNAFKTDPLRTIRAFRFAAELDFFIDPATATLIQEHAPLISNVPVERIMAEFLKICKTNHAATNIHRMDDMGLLEVMFPEIQSMRGCVQNDFHHLDVWGHSLLTLSKCEELTLKLKQNFPESANRIKNNLASSNRLALMKMAALFHDIGKPNTKKTIGDSNKNIFHDHEREGQKIISSLSKRLKMSTQDRGFLQTLVAEHMNIRFLSRPNVKKNTVLKRFRKLKDDIIPLIILEMADCMSTQGPSSSKSEREGHLSWSKKTIQEYYGKIRKKLEQDNWINGNDLLTLGMSPGPELGQALKAIREAQDLEKIQNRNQGMALAKRIVNNS